jgi:hypothetical protein
MHRISFISFRSAESSQMQQAVVTVTPIKTRTVSDRSNQANIADCHRSELTAGTRPWCPRRHPRPTHRSSSIVLRCEERTGFYRGARGRWTGREDACMSAAANDCICMGGWASAALPSSWLPRHATGDAAPPAQRCRCFRRPAGPRSSAWRFLASCCERAGGEIYVRACPGPPPPTLLRSNPCM